MIYTSDLSTALAGLFQRNTQLQQMLRAPVETKIAVGDGMYSGDDAHYLQIGTSALRLVMRALEIAGRRPDDIGSVLDYACGFGRVARWLHAAFPHVQFHAADLDAKAVAAVRSLLSVPTFQLSKDLTQPLPRNYDMIWVGSLLTHLPETAGGTVLGFLKLHLLEQGILVVTTHGAYVANRLRRRERTYNLTGEAIDQLLSLYDRHGFGFSPYEGHADYGISVSHPQKVLEFAHSHGLDPLYFEEKGWGKHQDCFAFRHSTAS